MYKRSVKILMK